ncbi:Ca2+-binding protein, RTX toxin-related [Syntrophus gentianae]|uniref:Ca2+-binding protein, RTX toxin-related n=1 Tax=Syntrophus gentianae TaxID=43775 RepID=A0A1H7VF92_9BACT|nr:calcium-binding protein [Syntrophus gentianae]SEM07518.1 Ca2+-binding protein, RTX toxin-related [Syntrophus gentianae]
MANLTVYVPTDMRDDLLPDYDPYDADLTTAKITSYRDDDYKDKTVFYGSFQIWDEDVIGGTITGIEHYWDGGIKQFTFNNFNLDVNQAETTEDKDLLKYNDTITGSYGADYLMSFAGNDTLNGGTGSDTMVGGTGNDTYIVDNAGDVVVEASGAGTDRVNAYINYVLGANVENLYLYGTATKGTGNALNNIIDGNASANTLSGLAGSDTLNGYAGNDTLNGGTGNDTMFGGRGNDLYYVDSTGDKVYETTTTTSTINAGGVDTVYSSLAAYTLGLYVENGRILSSGAANLTGNSLANTLYAGAGNNVLNGSTGTDTVSYTYAGSAVKVSLAVSTAQATGGSGSDTLSGFERLIGSNYNDNLTGNNTNNNLSGLNGNDILSGLGGNDILYGDAGNDRLNGGLGNDKLTGGAGADYFDFRTALNATTNKDTITDFSVADDTIRLENSIMTGLGTATGVLAVGAFHSGTVNIATQADDRIIYNTSTGALFYDADGTGATAAVQIAVIGSTSHPALTNADFMVI